MNHRGLYSSSHITTHHQLEIGWTCFSRSYVPGFEMVGALVSQEVTLIGSELAPRIGTSCDLSAPICLRPRIRNLTLRWYLSWADKENLPDLIYQYRRRLLSSIAYIEMVKSADGIRAGRFNR